MDRLFAKARDVAAMLVARQQTVAVAESSTGGLISAALLAVPGASAYYIGGGVVYTARARHRLLDLKREDMTGIRSASEAYAALLARTVQQRFKATWGLSETGASGPTGNPYGDAAGHSCFGVFDGTAVTRTLETGRADRLENMIEFATAALVLLEERIVHS